MAKKTAKTTAIETVATIETVAAVATIEPKKEEATMTTETVTPEAPVTPVTPVTPEAPKAPEVTKLPVLTGNDAYAALLKYPLATFVEGKLGSMSKLSLTTNNWIMVWNKNLEIADCLAVLKPVKDEDDMPSCSFDPNEIPAAPSELAYTFAFDKRLAYLFDGLTVSRETFGFARLFEATFTARIEEAAKDFFNEAKKYCEGFSADMFTSYNEEYDKAQSSWIMSRLGKKGERVVTAKGGTPGKQRGEASISSVITKAGKPSEAGKNKEGASPDKRLEKWMKILDEEGEEGLCLEQKRLAEVRVDNHKHLPQPTTEKQEAQNKLNKAELARIQKACDDMKATGRWDINRIVEASVVGRIVTIAQLQEKIAKAEKNA